MAWFGRLKVGYLWKVSKNCLTGDICFTKAAPHDLLHFMPELTTNRSQLTTKRSQLSSLAELFPNPTLVKVLSLFLLPEEEFYQRGIAEATGNALLQVQRALKRIERAGLVIKTRRGNMVYYKAERMHPAFEDLKRVFLKTVALGDVLRDALAPAGLLQSSR